MAFLPVALIIPQYEDYSGWWLKAYEQGTVTPLVMATDSTGVTTLAKCYIDSTGFPRTSSSTNSPRFIPYINGSYDLWLFPTEEEADGDITVNAIQFADNINAGQSESINTITESAMIFAGPTIWKETALADLKWDDTNKRFSVGVADSLEKAHIQDGNLLVTPGTNAVQGTPIIIGSLVDNVNLDGCSSVAIVGNYAYVANTYDDSVRVIDVSDPTTPVIVGGIQDATNLNGIHSIVCDGRYAYVSCALDASLRIIDISDPTTPVMTGGIQDGTNLNGIHNIYLSGQYIYASVYFDDSLRIIDISDPTTPVMTGGIQDGTNLNGVEGVYVVGKYAYMACQIADSLQIIDISDPTSPVIVGGLTDATNLNGAKDVKVIGKYAYIIAFTNSSLEIVDVSDPTTPVRIGGVVVGTGESSLDRLGIAGDYAYVSSVDGTLNIINITDPTDPQVVSVVTDAALSGALKVVIAGKYVYIACQSTDSLQIIDISGIKAPAASIGSLAATLLNVAVNALIGNNLVVGGGLNVGRDVNIGGSLSVDGEPVSTGGTWAPTIQDTSLSDAKGQVYPTQVGNYTKIGNRVFFHGHLVISDLGTLTPGSATFLGGLPFTSSSGGGTEGGLIVTRAVSLAITAGQSVSGYIAVNVGYAGLVVWDDTGGSTNLLISELSAGANIYFQGQYIV